MSSGNDAMSEVLWQQFIALQGLEAIAVVLAIAYVVLAAHKNIWCWLCAGISTLLYTIVFWHVNLPFQVVLNAYYVLMAVVGYWQWQRSGDEADVSRLTLTQNSVIIAVIFTVTAVLAHTVSSYVDTQYVYVDAFITIASVITTVMVVYKKLDNWVYWLVINAVSCWLYWQVELYLTSLLFLLYVGLSVYGLLQWRKSHSLTPARD
ncbi:nicotinamide riboside transporter PnuC [Alteromonas flava]|uniref:nicotinamide riboside transporter PnuC n=1 Tax=Alteromonas flava TaxID=2048003 RepID=UPI000C295421|nr:nicotinamide riboside transporter PnuC [Alteromonas flava]